MSKIISFYSTPPDKIESGDVFVAVVTCHMQVEGDTVYLKLYRCDYPPETYEGIPQGGECYGDHIAMAQNLFPVLRGFTRIDCLNRR